MMKIQFQVSEIFDAVLQKNFNWKSNFGNENVLLEKVIVC